jgi:acetyl esterase/lipase
MTKELQKKDLPVILVNQARDFNWEIHCNPDKVHPNYLGAGVMANTWFKALVKELKPAVKPYTPEIITYKEIENYQLKLHIFKPQKNKKANEKRPAIIFFFGGGWSVGTPLQFYRECAYYASKGIVAVSAEYRIKFLHNSTVFESVADAKSAIRWLRENSDKYNIDTARIAAAGASAGGHIAAVAGTINKFDEEDENQSISSKPNLLLLYYPVLDNSPSGYQTENIKDRFIEVSPIYNITTGAPPTLIILGTADPYLSVNQVEVYQQRMLDVGNFCVLKLYENAGHPIFYYRKGLSENSCRMLDDSNKFLKKYGYLLND